MSDRVAGSLTVSDDVFADLAGYAAKECYGVVGMATMGSRDMLSVLPGQRLRKGVGVRRGEGGELVVDLNVILEYGVNVSAVSRNLVDSVRFVFKNIAQISDVTVNVHVRGMKVRPE
jgi:uncharacterized alkaline shock family protein YloU